MTKLMTAAVGGLVLMSFHSAEAAPRTGACVDSPQKVLTVCVAANNDGPYYDVYRGDRQVISESRLGLVLEGFGNQPAKFVGNERRTSVDQTWEQPWGEQRKIRDQHQQLQVTLSSVSRESTEPYELTVRVFDEGFGFLVGEAAVE